MSRRPTLRVSSDNRLNPALAAEVGGLRGGMLAAAEARPLPARFSAVPHPDRPAMVVVDEQTGRSTTVGLFAYGALREALTDLFPGA